MSSNQHTKMKSKSNRQVTLTYRTIPNLKTCNATSSLVDFSEFKQQPSFKPKSFNKNGFACISTSCKKDEKEFEPTNAQFLQHPLAIVALVPRDVALFAAGAISGAAAKTFTAPLDRIKILMQTHGVRVGHESAKKAMGFFEAITLIGKEEGIKGYWKGNLPQVIRIIPYSAVQLFAYETYKKLFRGKDSELSVLGRLAAGACAGMTSTLVIVLKSDYRNPHPGSQKKLLYFSNLNDTFIPDRVYNIEEVFIPVFELENKHWFLLIINVVKEQAYIIDSLGVSDNRYSLATDMVTYPLDVLRLRLAVEPGYRTMSQVALSMLREEGIAAFYNGLGPSLIGIAPYIAVNFCVFDLVKKSLPEKYQKRPETSLVTALVSAMFATLTCYPLDTIRRQMQMRGTPYITVLDAFAGILERDGWVGLYRGFVPNALKNLPSSSIRLTTFDTVKSLVATSEKEFQRIVEENRKKAKATSTD